MEISSREPIPSRSRLAVSQRQKCKGCKRKVYRFEKEALIPGARSKQRHARQAGSS